MVDFLLELAEVTDKPVSREELFKEDEEHEAGLWRGRVAGTMRPVRLVARKLPHISAIAA